ncbi:hypothetical protein CULC0211_00110 [Corynebacterium ulcerans]|nr:hypothetical protein CULC0211_00110 [Corynebacterium ulcerans]
MTRVSAPRKPRRSPGWVPNQHGAWFMVTVPALIGVAFAPAWIDIPLLMLWWCGYFAFFAGSVWMRGGYRKRHLPPLAVYGAITAFAGLVVLLCNWRLVVWIPAFLPLVGIAVYETWRRRPRSLLFLGYPPYVRPALSCLLSLGPVTASPLVCGLRVGFCCCILLAVSRT